MAKRTRNTPPAPPAELPSAPLDGLAGIPDAETAEAQAAAGERAVDVPAALDAPEAVSLESAGAALVEVLEQGPPGRELIIMAPLPAPVDGLVVRHPTPKLTNRQAQAQNGLFHAVPGLRKQHDVYGYLLDLIADAAGMPR